MKSYRKHSPFQVLNKKRFHTRSGQVSKLPVQDVVPQDWRNNLCIGDKMRLILLVAAIVANFGGSCEHVAYSGKTWVD